MSEQTLISGWSIKQGDYKSDTEYDAKYVKDRKSRKVFVKVMILISGIAGITFLVLASSLVGKI
jgi:hypothetical protein